MIDLNCADCTSRHVTQAATKENSQTIVIKTLAKQQQEYPDVPNKSPLASPLIPNDAHSSSPALATPFELSSRSSRIASSVGDAAYQLNKSHLIPSLAPLHLLSSTAANANSHFALTPDARACVTATYLCVLIVNNTWLDCNLLEMLCHGSGYSSSAEEREQRQRERQMQRLKQRQLERRQAGGGSVGSSSSNDRISYREDDDTDEDDEDKSRARGINQDDQHIWSAEAEKLKSLQRSVQFPFELHRSQVGLPEKGGGERYYSETIPQSYHQRQSRLMTYPSVKQHEESAQPGADDEAAEDAPDEGESEQVKVSHEAGATDTRSPRGWGSYAFWTGANENPIRQQFEQHESSSNKLQQQQAAVQILRPVDKTEQQPRQFNDIASNQSASMPIKTGSTGGSFNYKPLIVLMSSSSSNLPPANNNKSKQSKQTSLFALQQASHHRQRPQQQRKQQVVPTSTSSNVGSTILPLNLHEPSTLAASSPSPKTSILMLEHVNHDDTNADITGQEGEIIAFERHLSSQSPLTSVQPAAALQADSSFSDTFSSLASGSVGMDSNQHRHVQNQISFSGNGHSSRNRQFQQLQYPSQQQLYVQQPQFSRVDECRCTSQSSAGLQGNGDDLSDQEMMLEQANCRPNKCSPLSGSLDGQLMSSTSFAIGQQVAAASLGSTTLAPSVTTGKMSPLDVTFILYTRLESALHVQPLSGGGSHTGEPDTTETESSSSSSSAPVAAAAAAEKSSSIENILTENGSGLEYLNASLPIKVVIHGFGSGGRRSWVSDMVYKLLEYEDVNVIVVDWEKGAALPNYVQAAGNTRLVGHKIASLIKKINAKFGVTGSSYHLIGFSLGAHVAGFAGMELRNFSISSNGMMRHHLILNRITGLDPASPLFEGYEANDRLDPSDAQFVDVIHSNGDGVLRGGFGSLQPMGHVDFYPNGGRVQVGCNSVLLSALSDIIHGKWQSLCNHRRALNFFMDSFEFNKCRFRSFNCESYESYLRGECFDCGFNNEKCSYMGYLANYSKGRGKMYLTTHEEAPFCANQFTIQIFGSKGFKSHWGKVEVTLVSNDGAKNESFWLSPSNQQQQTSISNGSSGSSGVSNLSGALSGGKSIENSSLTGSGSGSGSSGTNSGSGTAGGNGNSLAGIVQHESAGIGLGAPTSFRDYNQQPQSQQQQSSMRSLIVAYPSLVNLTQVLLRYTKYKGWIYSGDESWSIDKVLLTDSEGQMKSYCGFNTILESYVTSRLTLEPGNCTVAEPMSSGAGFDTPTPNGLRVSGSSVLQNSGPGPSSPSGLASLGAESQQQSPLSFSQSQQLLPAPNKRSPRLFAADQSSATPSSPLGHALQRLTSGQFAPSIVGVRIVSVKQPKETITMSIARNAISM